MCAVAGVHESASAGVRENKILDFYQIFEYALGSVFGVGGVGRERKSTRARTRSLFSTHVCTNNISQFAFCVRKKKKNTIMHEKKKKLKARVYSLA